MKKKYNPNRVKIHHSYTATEIAELLGVHVRTVRNWIKAGLPTIDSKRPLLISGVDLRQFLHAKNQKSKQRCLPSELFCVKCQLPRTPILESIKFLQDVEQLGRIIGDCSECSSEMNQFFSWQKINEVAKNLGMTLPLAQKHIIQRGIPLSNCT